METVSPIALPNDVNALKGIIVDQGLMIEKLKSQIAQMRRHQFGARSEGLDQ